MRKSPGLFSVLTGLSLLVVSLAAKAQVVTTLAGSGAQGSADGAGTAATFNLPSSVATDSSGNVYVADTWNFTIRKVTPNGVVSTIAGLAGFAGSLDGVGSAARFDFPSGVAVDPSGNVFVTDPLDHTIRKITASGVVSTFAGLAGIYGSADGIGSDARFWYPSGIATDRFGCVYVSDANNHKIRKITPSGVVSTLAGGPGGGANDGTGPTARFLLPDGVAVDGSGNVYVADNGASTIRKVTPNGVVSTIAGLVHTPGNVDGTGSAARFDGPRGIAVDFSGNVYVGEQYNAKVRKITPSGVVTTFAGSGAKGSADGTGTTATFRSPISVAVDSSGDIYVADAGSNKIRKITQSTCVSDAFTACLVGERYRVTSHWQNQYAGGQVSTLSATTLTDTTAAFWIANADTYEYLIRINTATDNGKAWISIPTFTDVEFWIAVTDTARGQYFEYHSPAYNKTMLYDPSFFVYP